MSSKIINLKQKKKTQLFPYFLIIPSIIILVVVTLFPFLYNIWISLHKFYLLFPKDIQFIGLANYLTALTQKEFWETFLTTILFTGGGVAIEFFLGFLIALLLSWDFKGKNILRTLFLIPMIITPIAVGNMWKLMYSPTLGIINYLLSFLGIRNLEWVADPKWALFSLVIVDAWQWTPFLSLIFLAGIISLPREPFEAALVDGASSLKTLRYIILPLLKPVFIVGLLFRLIDSLRTFDIIYSLTGGGPIRSTETFNIFIYLRAFRDLQIGYSSSLTLMLLFLIIIICTLIVRWSRIEILE